MTIGSSPLHNRDFKTTAPALPPRIDPRQTTLGSVLASPESFSRVITFRVFPAHWFHTFDEFRSFQ